MQIKSILYEPHFKRAFKKLTPELKAALIERLPWFLAECFDPRLKTHKLSEKYKDQWSFSISYSYRVLFEFLSENQVLFIDVDDHDIYR